MHAALLFFTTVDQTGVEQQLARTGLRARRSVHLGSSRENVYPLPLEVGFLGGDAPLAPLAPRLLVYLARFAARLTAEIPAAPERYASDQ